LVVLAIPSKISNGLSAQMCASAGVIESAHAVLMIFRACLASYLL
jgi:hypothetical protein